MKQTVGSWKANTPTQRWALDRHCSQNLVIDFQQSDYDRPRHGFLHICFVCRPPWFCKFMCFTKFGKFLATISSNYFFLLFVSATLKIHILDLLIPTPPKVPVHFFQYFFCLFFILGNLYWSIFKFTFTDSFLCHLHSVINPI